MDTHLSRNKSPMKPRPLLIALVSVVAMTVMSGMVQGELRNRWGRSEDMLALAAKLDEMPKTLGNWKMKSADKLSLSVMDMLQCTGYVARCYAHAKTGETVNVMVILGPAGPTAVHTPEICFSSRDYQQTEDRQVVVLKDATDNAHRFWSLAFKANYPRDNTLRVMYAWTDGSFWQAPEDARFAFAGKPYLYKIQIQTDSPSIGSSFASNACSRFLDDLIQWRYPR